MHLHYYTAVYKLIKCLQVRFTFGKIPNAFWTQVRIETNRTFRTFARTLSSCMTQNSCVARSSRPNCQQRWIMIYFFLLFAVRRCVFLTTTQPGTSHPLYLQTQGLRRHRQSLRCCWNTGGLCLESDAVWERAYTVEFWILMVWLCD